MEEKKSVPGLLLHRRDFLPYLLIFVAIFLLLSLFSFQEGDDGQTANWFGRLGHYISFTLLYLMGKASFFLSGFFLVLGVLSLRDAQFDSLSKALFFPIFLIASTVSLHILESPLGALGDQGGIFGQFFSWILNYLFGETGRVIVVFFMFLYFGVIWLEDDAWETAWNALNQLVNQVYRMFGGTKELPKIQFPAFFSDRDLGVSHMGTLAQSNKSWFEVKKESEPKTGPVVPSFLWDQTSTLDKSNFDPRESSWASKESVEARRVRYKNISLYEGFFDPKETTFRFQSASTRLQSKYTKDLNLSAIQKIKCLDLRSLPEIKSEDLFENVLYGIDDEISEETEEFDGSSNYRDSGEFDNDDEYDSENSEDLDETAIGFDDLEMESSLNLDSQEEAEETYGSEEDYGSDEISEIVESESKETVSALDELEERRKQSKPKVITKSEPEDQELMFGSMVPKLKLKKGKYYISPRLLESHTAPANHLAKFDSDLDRVSKKIEEAIGHFGIESKVISRERGPIITRYEITIPNGIKLSRIVSLSDELRAYLEVKNIRIVAPIPGKSTIGIEVPNRIREDVFLSEILKDSILQNKAKDLSLCIGKDISGKMVMIDLAKLPHLLVAGTTGSGKSVSLNAMITSLICTRSPEEVRFIMIDPKMVEMSLYEGIPHLLMPVITDPKKATKALTWAIQEMESRYQMISQLKSRDFKSFNDKVDEYAYAKGFQKLPYIVIFIDELADLMMVSGKDLEEQIQRISQKARAVGIHLVMATQRPSVDVITGVIKANCPARVAFQVAQKTDSRTILDTSGAESLLGKGDFLYRSPTSSDLMRIQAPFIEEKEIETIVEEAKKQGSPAYVEMNWGEETSDELVSDEDEELFDVAWNIVLTEKKASASYLQRRMRIGYNKAARLMELMELRGYVSAQIGAKPREILRSA